MKTHNRLNVYYLLKAGKLGKETRQDLEKYGLLREYNSFEEFQEAILEYLKSKKTTRKKLEKLKEYLKAPEIVYPLSTSSDVARRLAKKFKLNKGDVIAFLRANAFRHIPATKRYLRTKRYETPIATRLYTHEKRKKRKSMKDQFSYEQLAEAILEGEVAIARGKLAYYTLKIASLGLEHEGPYALEEPPDELKPFFEREERRVKGQTARLLNLDVKDSDVITLIKRSLFRIDLYTRSLELYVESF